MFLFPPTFILRHRKENLKKCSLKGMEQRTDMRFFTYPKDALPDLSSYLVLTIDAPPLTANDSMYGLFLIDGTWKHAETMFQQVTKQQHVQMRSLPNHFLTAYPRRQDDCSDPLRGLASVEALFIAYRILDRESEGLLDNYYWKEAFLKKNENGLSSSG